MWWFVYTALAVNLSIIWCMPKRLTRKEIYVTWFIIALLNLSSDFIFNLYFKLYELDGPGIQLRVHLLELSLGASYGIIFLNFMPHRISTFIWYLIGWLAYSVLFEAVLVYIHYVNYSGWRLWYSAIFYFFSFLFLRWHIHYIRTNEKL
jgi:hypothetical protein